ncbi:SCO family protein [Bacillus sp. V5-8f]|uniref:SCO family protein n=1 Tax=Bacillus sp. V5-8f TaxID=2053044 RepID=UPI000C76DAAA|nr:SCO family protein [Bacillus sp. V5-8f]PLT34957.1 cytochrome c oxidase assembly protein [Bacillus sp. V5-8f]
MKKLKLSAAAIIFGTILLLAACGPGKVPDAKNWDVDSFTFTDQDREPFSKSDLKGKVWVADFIFTNCETVCLPMTSNMAKLQERVKEEGLADVEFVSFSVDPEMDTPDVLKKYASTFHVDFSNWHFLTGYGQKEIEQFAMENFKTIVQKPKEQDQVIHGTDFYLVDQDGKIIRYYTGLNKIPMDEIIKHIKILQSN